IYSVVALVTLKFWLLLPASLASVVSPSLPRLRNLFGINAVGAYTRLKNAAGSLSLAHSHAFPQDLLARLYSRLSPFSHSAPQLAHHSARSSFLAVRP